MTTQKRTVNDCERIDMAATAMFQRRNIDLFKTIILRLPRSRLCSVDGSDEEQSNENISDDPEAVLQGKKLDLVVPTLRVDRVLASALGIGRRLVVNLNFSMSVPYIVCNSLGKVFETPRGVWYNVMINYCRHLIYTCQLFLRYKREIFNLGVP